MRRFVWIVLALAAAQTLVALVRAPGTLLIDEVTYHAMARALAEHGTLALGNGLDVAASPELEWEHARIVGGRLVAQYPAGHAVLAWPFYRLLGVRGFTVLTTLAFFGTVLVTRALAERVLRKRGLATIAAIVFSLGTYAWEYSLSIWPHTVTLLFTTSAFFASLRACERSGAWFGHLAAGALVGLATTIRLDAVFMLPAVLVMPAVVGPELRTRSGSLGLAALALVGTIPAVAFLAMTNHVKFGSWQPFSYGPWHAAGSNTALSAYAPLAAAGALALVAVHVIRRPRVTHAIALAVGVVAIGCVLHERALKVLDGWWMILVDLRHSDPAAVQPALSHSPRGAMMYIGALKKSFLQSLPWLPLAVVAPFMRGIDARARRRLLAISIPLVLHCAVFGGLHWHGGLCLNLRYLLPGLPFAAILATYSGYRLLRRSPLARRALRQADAILLFIVAAWLAIAVVVVLPSSLAVREIFFLDGALVLAGLVAVAYATKRATLALALGVVAVVWAGMTGLSYDALATLRQRASNARVAARVRSLAPPGSFLFAEYPDLVSDAIEDDDVIAAPRRDGYRDVLRLATAAAERGRASFAVLSPASSARLRARFPPEVLQMEAVAAESGFTLHRLTPREGPSREVRAKARN